MNSGSARSACLVQLVYRGIQIATAHVQHGSDLAAFGQQQVHAFQEHVEELKLPRLVRYQKDDLDRIFALEIRSGFDLKASLYLARSFHFDPAANELPESLAIFFGNITGKCSIER